MSTPYSVLFGHLPASATGVTVFTVPVGHVYIVRDVDIYQDQPGAAAVVRMSELVANVFWFAAGMPASRYSWLQWQGRQVFDAGQQLAIYADLGVTTVFRISGYDLSV